MLRRLNYPILIIALTSGLAYAQLAGGAPARNAMLRLPPPAARPVDSGMGFTPDKGKFRILQDGVEVGTEEFDLSPAGNAAPGSPAVGNTQLTNTWIAHGEAILRVPGSGETRSSGQLRLAADGTPLHYEWTAQSDKKASGSVDFENGTAKSFLTVGGNSPIHMDFKFNSPRVAILDNNLFDQYALVARLYDWNIKGTQTFPVLVSQDMRPGSMDVESQGNDTLRVRMSDIECELYFDARHHLIRIEFPSLKVVVVRQ